MTKLKKPKPSDYTADDPFVQKMAYRQMSQLCRHEHDRETQQFRRKGFRLSKPSKYDYPGMVGTKMGRWTVIRLVQKPGRETSFSCQCECGTMKEVLAACIRRGESKSCGCLQLEIAKTCQFKHGHVTKRRPSRTYRIWQGMKSRCFRSTDGEYHRYGARGITVCESWIGSFQNFLEDMGTCPAGLTIERIDNNGNYKPGNCRWATPKEQANNTRRNRWVTIGGDRKTICEWFALLGINNTTFYRRRKSGMSVEHALLNPPRRWPNQSK